MNREKFVRGFTMIELMVVVLIAGILAAMGISSVQAHVRKAKNVQALANVRAIAAAMEKDRALRGYYLDVSPDDATFFPTSAPDGTEYKVALAGNWLVINPAFPATVTHGFNVRAGRGVPDGDAWPTLQATTTPTWPTATQEPWYVIQALGDNDGDGETHYILVSSFNSTVYQEGLAE